MSKTPIERALERIEQLRDGACKHRDEATDRDDRRAQDFMAFAYNDCAAIIREEMERGGK